MISSFDSGQLQQPGAHRRLLCPDKGAHELAIDQRGNGIHIDFSLNQEMPGIIHRAHARRLHRDAAKAAPSPTM